MYIVILTEPRTGSTYLCSQIRRGEEFNSPELFEEPGKIKYEVLNPENIKSIYSAPPANNKLRDDLLNYKGNNCLIKIHYRQLTVYTRAYNAIHKTSLNPDQLIDELCPRVDLFINLQRKDIIEQAVSYFIASKTLQWWSGQEKKNDEPEYNFDLINKEIELIKKHNSMLDDLCKPRKNIKLYYENLFNNIQPTEQVLSSVLPYDFRFKEEKKNKVKKQSSSIKDEYVQRAREEMSKANI